VMTGTIKRLIADKGFGFLRAEQGGQEFFFHRSGVLGQFEDLHEGDRVEFEEGQAGAKGPRADRVRAA